MKRTPPLRGVERPRRRRGRSCGLRGSARGALDAQPSRSGANDRRQQLDATLAPKSVRVAPILARSARAHDLSAVHARRDLAHRTRKVCELLLLYLILLVASIEVEGRAIFLEPTVLLRADVLVDARREVAIAHSAHPFAHLRLSLLAAARKLRASNGWLPSGS